MFTHIPSGDSSALATKNSATPATPAKPATPTSRATAPAYNHRDYTNPCASRDIESTDPFNASIHQRFQFRVCLNKTEYENGDTVSMNQSLTNTGQVTAHIKDWFMLEVLEGSKTVFSSEGGCFIPEGCDFPAGQTESLKSSLALPGGHYVLVVSLLGLSSDCRTDGGLLPTLCSLPPITISIDFTVED